MSVDPQDDLEEEMLKNIGETNPPAPSEGDEGATGEAQQDQQGGEISAVNWALVGPIVEAESKRCGISVEDLVAQVWEWAITCRESDPHQRTVENIVVDFLIDAGRRADQLEVEYGIAQNGGAKAAGTLISPEEMEASRRALFKPTITKKSNEIPRGNAKRDQKHNQGRQLPTKP